MLFCKRILLFVLLVILTSCEEESTQESLADIPPTAQATIVEYLWSLCDPNLSGTYCSTYAEYVGYRTSHPNWTWHDYEVVNPLFKYLNQETFEYLYDQHVQWRDILISYEDWKRQYDSCQSALAVALPKLRPSVSSKYKNTGVLCEYSARVCSMADLPTVSFQFSGSNDPYYDGNQFKYELQLEITKFKSVLAKEGLADFSGFDCQ